MHRLAKHSMLNELSNWHAKQEILDERWNILEIDIVGVHSYIRCIERVPRYHPKSQQNNLLGDFVEHLVLE